MPEKGPPKRNPKNTLAICIVCLVLGVPVSAVAINLEMTFFPAQPLRNLDTIIRGPHTALIVAAFLSIITSVLVMLATLIIRHMMPNNVVVGAGGFGVSVLNFSTQLVTVGIINITNSQNPESNTARDVRFINGQYDAGGKTFTQETWACTMRNLFANREPWSTNACSEYHYARYCVILQVITALLLLAIAYWPVRKSLFARRKHVASVPGGKGG